MSSNLTVLILSINSTCAVIKIKPEIVTGNITHAWEFQTLYFLVAMASEDRTEKIAKNIEFLLLKKI